MKIYSVVIVFFMVIFTLNAFSQVPKDSAKAKEHFLKAKAFVEEGAYEKAIIELKTSYDLDPLPSTLYNIAVCYDKLHKYADAVKYYNIYLEKGKGEPQEKRQKVSERIKELKTYLGLVSINVDKEGTEVVIDDQVICITPCSPVFLETGEHEVIVRKGGFSEAEKKITVVSGENIEVLISISPTVSKETKQPVESKEEPIKPTEKSTPVIEHGKVKRKPVSPAVFWSLLGITVASGVSWVAVGAMVIKKDREVTEMSTNDPEYKSARDDGKKLALTADILMGLTTGFAVASITTYFFTDLKKLGKKEKNLSLSASTIVNKNSLVFGVNGDF